MRSIVFASSNRHKVTEIAAMLPEGLRIITLAEAGFTGLIEETADTIRGNSLLKATALKKFLSERKDTSLVMADDSGLEVKALGGAPGVRSARYSGKDAGDSENVIKLLNEMNGKTSRQARFVTVITLLDGYGEHFFEGEITGTIAYGPRGTNGFGYDPVFIPTGYRSTFAELSPGEKNAISHRSVALRKCIEYLNRQTF